MTAGLDAGLGIEKIRIARNAAATPVPSPRRLAGIITGGAVALSLVLATALPAKAGGRNDDLAKALIAALVVGAIIHETRKDDKPAPAPAPDPVHKKKKKKKHDSARVPAACGLQFEGERRDVTVYPESCLLDHGMTRHLPRHCAREARIFGEWDRIYGEKCLREAGFRLPSRDYGDYED